MFAIIDTKGANKIAIYIPHQGADKTLPALAAMLEQNATFINAGWRDASVVKPEMTISLSNTFSADRGNEAPEIVINASQSVIDDSFVPFSPDVRISYKKVIDKKDQEISQLRLERDTAKMERDRLQDQIKALTSTEEA